MIALFYGTRPEYIKLKPIMKSLDKRFIKYKIVQVSQHTDLIKDCKYDEEIKIYNSSSNRLNDIICSILSHSEVFLNCKFVLVQGDTTTALAVALSAFNNKVPIIHVEAGMRTYDKNNPYPEEVNRRMISSMASIHYCATPNERQYLINEGLQEDSIKVTGNTVIDNLKNIKIKKNNKIVITLHRRENHDKVKEWFSMFDRLASEYKQYEFIFLAHPNPNISLLLNELKNVLVIDQIAHEDMLELISSCHCLITDSGGLQEESSFFKKLCFVCRRVTERPCESSVLCKDPQTLYVNFCNQHNKVITSNTPFGDGMAGEKIAEDIQTRI